MKNGLVFLIYRILKLGEIHQFAFLKSEMLGNIVCLYYRDKRVIGNFFGHNVMFVTIS